MPSEYWHCWGCQTTNERESRVCRSCGREAGREADLDDGEPDDSGDE